MDNRLRELRKERRLTQAALGALVGASRQTINLIENTRHDPSLGLAFAISNLFGLPIEAIFFESPPGRTDLPLAASQTGGCGLRAITSKSSV